MKAWIERTHPPGPRIELDDSSGPLSFGRGAQAKVILDEPSLAPRHLEVAFEEGFWHARALGPLPLPELNGALLDYPRPLFDGDTLDVGPVRLTFRLEAPPENEALLAAVRARPDSPEATLVWADWLQEQGDPLGERIARAARGERLDHQPWLGPLWQHFIAGELEIDWQLGLARSAVIRAVSRRPPPDWRGVLAHLCGLRVARFLRVLEIDVLRLERAGPDDAAARIERALTSLASQPRLPPLLARLSLGTRWSATPTDAPAVFASRAIVARAPVLAHQRIFGTSSRARLVLQRAAGGVTFVGIAGGTRLLAETIRLRRASPTQLHLETPPRLPMALDGRACFFAPDAVGWTLTAGHLRGELRVNGRVDSAYILVDGDAIELQGAGLLRYELVHQQG